MIRLIALLVALTTAAHAQTIPTPGRSGRNPGQTAPVSTMADVMPLFGTKVDTTNGVLTTPTMNGPTISAGLSMTGNGEIVFVPRGSPIAGSRASSMATYRMNHSVQEFSDARECDSFTHSPALGGNVCHYTYVEAHPTSGQVWARNAVTLLSPGFDSTQYSALGDEIDINNGAGNYGTFGATNSIGLLFNGLGYMNTAAISIQTGNTTGTLPIWYNGIYFGPNSISQYAYHDVSSAPTSMYIQNNHVFALDTSDANTSSAAIRLGNGGQTQGIVGHVRSGSSTVDYSVFFVDATGHAHVGSPTLGNWNSEGTIIPSLANTYSLGTPTNPWSDVRSVATTVQTATVTGQLLASTVTLSGNITPTVDISYNVGTPSLRLGNVNTLQVNGVPPPSVGTPASATAACVAGQIMFDPFYHYDCVSTNAWRRVATASW